MRLTPIFGFLLGLIFPSSFAFWILEVAVVVVKKPPPHQEALAEAEAAVDFRLRVVMMLRGVRCHSIICLFTG